MSKIHRFFHNIKRFFITWQEYGLRFSISIAIAKVKGVVRAQRPDVNIKAGVDPAFKEIYETYLAASGREPSNEYEAHISRKYIIGNFAAKLIAFYLPQFHPIPENDLWWGKGFTEWTNVTRGVPNFPSHYQPRLPGELGFYDLRVQDILRRQVELAKNYGVYGFCFHYYWFSGKRLLEKPLNNFINDPEIDFPFCLCWANENWSRRWDGRSDDILIQQEHSFEVDKLLIHDLVNIFTDPRYIKIENRPVMIVYRATILKEINRTIDYWRKFSIDHGTGDPYIIEAQLGDFKEPSSIGFDGVVEFPPNGVPPIPQGNYKVKITNPDFKGFVFDYRDIAEAMMNKPVPAYKLFKTVIPSWDNTPRRQNNSIIFTNSTPYLYQNWLENAIDFSINNNKGEDNLVFINAWNEWAEGAYLEPDQKYGYAYLRATWNALHSFDIPNCNLLLTSPMQPNVLIEKKHDTAVILHIFYSDLWEDVKNHLTNLSGEFDLYVSLPQGSQQLIKMITTDFPTARIFEVENRGRDMAPFVKIFSIIAPLSYRYICKVHSKKSKYSADGNNWRSEIFEELMGSPNVVDTIKKRLDQDNIGMIGPYGNILSTREYIGGNADLIMSLAERLNLPYDGSPFNFIAGSMFWVKPIAISAILNLNLRDHDFPLEQGQRDATLAHALERFLCYLSEYNGYKVIQTRDYSTNKAVSFRYATPQQ